MMPERTCIGCRVRRPQQELLRFRRRKDGEIVPSISRDGKGGRSAYLCGIEVCFVRAGKKKAMEAALGRGQSIRWSPRDLLSKAKKQSGAMCANHHLHAIKAVSCDSKVRPEAHAQSRQGSFTALTSDFPSMRRDS